jgi:hypothetical protein
LQGLYKTELGIDVNKEFTRKYFARIKKLSIGEIKKEEKVKKQ